MSKLAKIQDSKLHEILKVFFSSLQISNFDYKYVRENLGYGNSSGYTVFKIDFSRLKKSLLEYKQDLEKNGREKNLKEFMSVIDHMFSRSSGIENVIGYDRRITKPLNNAEWDSLELRYTNLVEEIQDYARKNLLKTGIEKSYNEDILSKIYCLDSSISSLESFKEEYDSKLKPIFDLEFNEIDIRD